MKKIIVLIAMFILPSACVSDDDVRQPNIILIAVDDMEYNTPTSFGGKIKGLTPNIDKLAAQGMKFTQAYNTSSRCAPSRGSMMTGHYQDNYNVKRGTGNTTVRPSVLTIPEFLKQKGYMTGLFGKDTHYRPLEKYNFDQVSPMAAMAVGRSPELYAQNTDAFIKKALAENRPFFISANTHDPHRPYAGAPGELKSLKKRFRKEIKHITEKVKFVRAPKVEKYSGINVKAPGFIPDHEMVREEFAYYLNSSHRADQFVGKMIEVLEENGVLDNTLVIFLSDNGMHWPFSKSNNYVASVKAPFVVYWKGHSVAGTSSDSLVSTIDILPTILEAAGITVPDQIPGKSLLPLLQNPEKQNHQQVFATMNGRTNVSFEMRSVIGEDYIYIYNKWADGKKLFYNGKYSGGLALKGFIAAAKNDKQARKRLDFFYKRTKEELYDIKKDPDALNNLLAGEKPHPQLSIMRDLMLKKLSENDDPYLNDFKQLLIQTQEK